MDVIWLIIGRNDYRDTTMIMERIYMKWLSGYHNDCGEKLSEMTIGIPQWLWRESIWNDYWDTTMIMERIYMKWLSGYHNDYGEKLYEMTIGIPQWLWRETIWNDHRDTTMIMERIYMKWLLGYTRLNLCTLSDGIHIDYGVATVSRIDKIIGLFCRIASLS